MEIRCVKGMCGLKVARSEENLGFKGLKISVCYCFLYRNAIFICHVFTCQSIWILYPCLHCTSALRFVGG